MKPEDIKAHRKSRGLTQEQLATMMQVDSTTIYRWENGIVAPSLAKSTILRDILVKAGDGLTHPFVDHLISRDMATAVLDFHDLYHRVNREYERLTGMPRIKMVGNRAWELMEELAEFIVEKGNVDLDKIVQGKIACIRVKNLMEPTTRNTNGEIF